MQELPTVLRLKTFSYLSCKQLVRMTHLSKQTAKDIFKACHTPVMKQGRQEYVLQIDACAYSGNMRSDLFKLADTITLRFDWGKLDMLARYSMVKKLAD